MKDLTKGRPSVLILTFALPIFLANLLQLTYSLADTRIVGTFLGDNALAAVGATTTLSNLIVQFLMGMCNGFAIISAQCFGAKDMDRLRRSLGNSLVLGLLAAVVLTIGGLVFLQLVTIMGGVSILFSVILAIQTLVRYLMGTAVEGFTTVILLILIIGGFIMLSLGVIGHYIARIYEEVKGRPKYIISHVTENVPGTAVGSWKREHRES